MPEPVGASLPWQVGTSNHIYLSSLVNVSMLLFIIVLGVDWDNAEMDDPETYHL